MTGDAAIQAMVDFITRRFARQGAIHADTPLVSSGLVDSFALVDMVAHLETVTGRRIPPGQIAPIDLETIRRMVETAERIGLPRS